jgi:nucleoside-triphosphatase
LSRVWVVTGPPGVGKSTVVSKVILRLKSAGVIVGGCVTAEERERGVRVGFQIKDLTDGKTGELASVAGRMGPRVGKYRVNLVDLAAVGASGLERAAAVSEMIVIDELGPLELVSPDFRRAVAKCVDSEKPILAVLHERMEDDLLIRIRGEAVKTFSLTVESRDSAAEELVGELLDAVGGPRST